MASPAAAGSPPARLADKYEVGAQVGRGSFGVVRCCTDCQTGEALVVKIIDTRPMRLNGTFNQERIMREAAILSSVQHENIVRLVECFVEDECVKLVMERAAGLDLFECILQRGHYSEADAHPIFLQLTKALAHLHDHQIVHRDVKPDNVRVLAGSVGQDPRVKLMDFGLSKVVNPAAGEVGVTLVGTPCYIAPEIEQLAYQAEPGQDRTYGLPVDSWSLGCVLVVMLTARYPEFDRSSGSPLVRTTGAAWHGVSASAKDLISALMQPQPSHRLTTKAALAHPWLARGGPGAKASPTSTMDSPPEQSVRPTPSPEHTPDLPTPPTSTDVASSSASAATSAGGARPRASSALTAQLQAEQLGQESAGQGSAGQGSASGGGSGSGAAISRRSSTASVASTVSSKSSYDEAEALFGIYRASDDEFSRFDASQHQHQHQHQQPPPLPPSRGADNSRAVPMPSPTSPLDPTLSGSGSGSAGNVASTPPALRPFLYGGEERNGKSKSSDAAAADDELSAVTDMQQRVFQLFQLSLWASSSDRRSEGRTREALVKGMGLSRESMVENLIGLRKLDNLTSQVCDGIEDLVLAAEEDEPSMAHEILDQHKEWILGLRQEMRHVHQINQGLAQTVHQVTLEVDLHGRGDGKDGSWADEAASHDEFGPRTRARVYSDAVRPFIHHDRASPPSDVKSRTRSDETTSLPPSLLRGNGLDHQIVSQRRGGGRAMSRPRSRSHQGWSPRVQDDVQQLRRLMNQIEAELQKLEVMHQQWEVGFDQMLKQGERVKRLVNHASNKPRIMARLQTRLDDYELFWSSVASECAEVHSGLAQRRGPALDAATGRP